MKTTLFSIKSLFLDNKTVKQTIFKNTFWLGLGTAISRLLGFILLVYIARILGAGQYGKFTFALSFVSLFLVFLNLGLPQITVREFSKEERRKDFYSLVSLKILLSMITFILIVIGSLFITGNYLIRVLIWLLGGYAVFSGFSAFIYDFFQARQKMEYQALGIILESLLLLIAGLAVIFYLPLVENLSYAYFFSSLAALILILIFFNFKVFPLKIYYETQVWKKFLLMSWPLALVALFGSIHNYIDSVMMGYLNQLTENGWYNAAYRLANLAILPMSFIVVSFYPVLSRIVKESAGNIQKIWNSQMEIIIILLVPMIIGGLFLAPRIIEDVYGSDFSPSVFAFQILILMVGVIFVQYPLNYILIAFNQQKKIFLISFLGALINIILNLLLIPKFSLYGAAVSTLITHLFIFVLYFGLASKIKKFEIFNLKSISTLIMAALSGFIMYLLISAPWIYNLHIFISVSIGALSYIIIILILKTWISNSTLRQNLN